jgi:ParB family chromosome partitioning protein
MAKPEFRPDDTPGIPHKLVEKSPRVFRRIATELLREPHDAMRHDMDDAALDELRQSFRVMGVLQPLCVVPMKDGVWVKLEKHTEKALAQFEAEGGLYEVRAGHRRLLAGRGINLESLPCVVFLDVDVADRAIMYHENSFREDPTDYDKAVMYAEAANVSGVTERELEKLFGRRIGYIYDRMKILEWPEDIRNALHAKQINFGIGKRLASVKDENYQRYFLNMAIMQGATINLVNNWINEWEGRTGAMAPMPPRPANQPVAVTNPAAPLECVVCGPKPSYELRSALICGECLENIEAAQEATQETSPPQPEPSA